MKKKVAKHLNSSKRTFLLGVDDEGTYYWLEEAQWDCGWYWGGGYVETYTNNKNPERARDISSHQHFDSLFMRGGEITYDAFRKFFKEITVTDKELWTLCELMHSFYIARKYSDMLYTGGAHYTTNPARATIMNQTEYDRINKEVIPAIMEEVYKLLSPETTEA